MDAPRVRWPSRPLGSGEPLLPPSSETTRELGLSLTLVVRVNCSRKINPYTIPTYTIPPNSPHAADPGGTGRHGARLHGPLWSLRDSPAARPSSHSVLGPLRMITGADDPRAEGCRVFRSSGSWAVVATGTAPTRPSPPAWYNTVSFRWTARRPSPAIRIWKDFPPGQVPENCSPLTTLRACCTKPTGVDLVPSN